MGRDRYTGRNRDTGRDRDRYRYRYRYIDPLLRAAHETSKVSYKNTTVLKLQNLTVQLAQGGEGQGYSSNHSYPRYLIMVSGELHPRPSYPLEKISKPYLFITFIPTYPLHRRPRRHFMKSYSHRADLRLPKCCLSNQQIVTSG
jgi:hypothetical protein